MGEQKFWLVSYVDKEGKAAGMPVESPVRPSNEEAAMKIREHLLGENFVLVDAHRGEREPTVALLAHYGYAITSIEQVL